MKKTKNFEELATYKYWNWAQNQLMASSQLFVMMIRNDCRTKKQQTNKTLTKVPNHHHASPLIVLKEQKIWIILKGHIVYVFANHTELAGTLTGKLIV